MTEADAVSLAEEIVLDNDTGLYELIAVVSHQGRSADGGHYVAWVKKDEGRKYIFIYFVSICSYLFFR